MIDLPRLIACGIEPSTARIFEGALSVACVQFGIATLEQQAGFLAQAMHESRNLTRLEESLWYSTPENIKRAFKRLRVLDLNELTKLCKNPKGLALAAYSNVNGNGGPETGHGWTYRGAGPFQLTGLGNFKACGDALGRPFVQHPEFLRVPGLDAALSAAWFFASKGCNAMMASGRIDECSVRINGGDNGLKERRALYGACLEALR